MTPPIFRSLFEGASIHKRLVNAYLIGLGLLGLFCMARWPIFAMDTDLWMHLSHGKYFFEHHQVSHDSYFSFIVPPRSWVNYFWLFDSVVYALYVRWGYYGLICLRGFLSLAALGVVVRYLFKARSPRSVWWWPHAVAAVYIMVLIPRQMNLRPHLTTYVAIPALLYCLEFRPRYTMLLPLLGLLWCNLHGVMYPVMLLIAGAYIGEYLLGRLAGGAYDASQARRFLLPVILLLPTVFLTPAGSSLLPLPFMPRPFIASRISEFKGITLEHLTSAQVTNLVPSYETWFNLLLVAVCAALVRSIAARRFRISHGVLLMGGAALLTQGNRFIHECALLSLPLLAVNPPIGLESTGRRTSGPLVWIAAGMVMLMPVLTLRESFGRPPRYPVTYENLPQGVMTFLQRLNVGGTVFNHPNSGGYARWMLSPTYKIFMDLEGPMYFTDTDFFLGLHAFHDARVFREIVTRYDPAFVTVPHLLKSFEELIKEFPEYVPVFFDDLEVLYVNRRRHPSIAERYQLSAVNPFRLEDALPGEGKQPPDTTRILQELARLMRFYPEGQLANYLTGALLNRDRAYDRALAYGQTVVTNFPEVAVGYEVIGDAMTGLRAYDRAIDAYRCALKRARREFRQPIEKKLGLAYLDRQDYRKAYQWLKRSVNPYDPNTSMEDLYSLGSAALFSSDTHTGVTALRYALRYRRGADGAEWAKKIRSLLTQAKVIPPG